MRPRALLCLVIFFICVTFTFAQDVQREVLLDQPGDNSVLVAQVAAQGAVPKLVKFSGALRDAEGKALTGTTSLTFAVYKSKDDVQPLWTETRAVSLDADG